MTQRRRRAAESEPAFRTIRDSKGREEFVLVPSALFAVIRPRLNAILEDPFYRRLASAPLDDEEETADETLAAKRARRARDRGEVISHEEVIGRYAK
ncbi:MAG: hypothetical protein IT350_10630 [Deltaproteobacteria bacterium]|nr:hypothetical protein [Deltaproteobacteria bacterium]